jgi:hypothetical protein
VDALAAALEQGARRLDRTIDDRRDLRAPPAQLDLPAHDAAHVQEVVHEACEMHHLSFEHLELA